MILFFLFVFFITAGLGCQGGSSDTATANKPITLKFWRVWDSEDDFGDIINAYKAIHPNISIEYKRFRYEEYEKALLEAFAEDRGPDIFSISNGWVGKYVSKISPMPASVSLPYPVTKSYLGGLKKETTVEMRSTKMITAAQLREKFIDVVYNDVVMLSDKTAEIYGLPMSVDTMVLFYNKDLLNSAGIPQPPSTWLEFQDDVKKITKQDKQGNFVYSGGAIGTSSNVARSFDLLSLLMMQNGTRMTEGSTVTFNKLPAGMSDRSVVPGVEALTFYTDFAYPAKEVYTWNDQMPNSLDAFISGKVAFFFGYSYHLKDILNRAPKLSFGYSAMPQIEGNQAVNYANYWVETVAKKSSNTDWAWDFLQFAAANDKQAKTYLDKTELPTALRSLINYQVEKEKLLPFVNQLLTAKNWYHGNDLGLAENIFKEMIDSVVQAQASPAEALGRAIGRVQQTM